MAKAGDKGIWLGDYFKQYEQPEAHVRAQLDRDELHHTWVDPQGNKRASDDGGERPPKGWWLSKYTKIDYERHSVEGLRYPPLFFPPMYFIRVFPGVAPKVEARAKRGRPSSAPTVLEEAKRLARSKGREGLIRQGRGRFLKELEDWLDKHPDANVRPMKDKTIGDHLRKDVKVRALLPESWFRRR